MNRIARLRRALGFIREGDPGAWRCYAGHWTDQDRCPSHRTAVLRAPISLPPPPSAPPPRRAIHVVIHSDTPR